MRPAAALFAAVLVLAEASEARQTDSGAARKEQAPQPGDVGARLWSLLSPPVFEVRVDKAALSMLVTRMGTDVIRPAIDVLLGESEEPVWEYEIDARTIDQRPWILLDALRHLPRADVLRAIDAAIRERKDVCRRIGLAKILSDLGGEESLRRILAITTELEPIQWESASVQVPLQESIARLVRGNERLAMAVARTVRSSDPALAVILARGLAQAGAWSTAGELASALGRHSRLDLCLAETLVAFAECAAGPLPETVPAALRNQLEVSDSRIACAAAQALGHLGDAASAERLLRLADDPDPLLRSGGNSALANLCGRDLPVDRESRDAWLKRERTWSEERLPELERTVLEGDPVLLTDALAELAAHRMFRHRAASALLPMLWSENPAVVRLACRVLPGFRSRTVAPALRALAKTDASDIQSAAASALYALTGEGAAPAGVRKPSDP